MQTVRFYFFAFLVLCLGSLSAVAQHSFVHAFGSDLLDGSGNKLMLRGTNLGNWLEPEGYMFHFEGGPQSTHEIEALTEELLGPEKSAHFWQQWRETYITKADMDRIKREGFNSVRVPIHWKFFDSQSDEGFRLIDRLVQWAREDSIYVILDLHCAPGGQTGTNIDDSDGYPWLFSSPEAQAHTIAVWRRIAARYHDEPIILGYDLLNEPIPHFPALQQYNKDLEPFYRKMSAAIRQVDRNHVLIFGGAQWDSNFKVFGAPFDRNAMYTFHKYWTAADESVIREYLDFRNQYKVPIWLGESGENKDEWVAAFTRTLEANRVGWCFWPYKKMDAPSSPVTFAKPSHWDEIVKFAALPGGTGNAEKRIAARPPQADIDEAFADLLNEIKFPQERVNGGYVKALGLSPDN